MKIRRAVIALVASLAGVVGLRAGEDAPGGGFAISTRRPEDAVEVCVDGDRTRFDVTSPRGIGQAVIARRGDRWPKTVVLRLRLAGLESIRLRHDTIELEGSGPNPGNGRPNGSWARREGGTEVPLDRRSPLWSDIRALDRDGRPTGRLPLPDGSFELTIPNAFLDSNPTAIAVQWVDFYRG